jgi:regulator of protease activity HflC (stomatin/prohibitin superfamily)
MNAAATPPSAAGVTPEFRESPLRSLPGVPMLLLVIALWLLAFFAGWRLVAFHETGWAWVMPVIGVGVFLSVGLYMLQPNEAANLTLFGRYAGTDRANGLRWANPFLVKHKLSLRARNLAAPTLKVNDQRGNPIEIGAAVVWCVRDAAQAAYEVDDFERYVQVQAEAALRHLASLYPYDEGESHGQPVTTLRGSLDEVCAALRAELQARCARAGVDVTDARLTHLAYAPEIAQVMLRRQQAEAIVSARHKIVQGAVGMVEAALQGLSEREIVQLDDERKAAMVSNLLVVLCGDRETQPVVNTGTLYA